MTASKKATTKPIRVALYTRVSTEMQANKDEGSLDTQQERLRQAVGLRDGAHRVVGIFREEGASGGTLDRPKLAALMADVRAGKIDLVMATRIDRLSRSLMDFLALQKELDKHGVQFVSLKESFDTDTAMGRAMLQLLLVFAELERAQTAELWVGGVTPLGYLRDPKTATLVVVEKEAEIVRNIFERYVAIASAPRVAREVNEAGLRQRNGKKFNPGNILKVVRNRVYLGEIRYHDEHLPGRHTAIVDVDTFARAQAALAANQKRRYRQAPDLQHEYLLTGLAFDSAGTAFTPKPSTSQTGRRYPYYESSGKTKRVDHECEVTRVRAGELEAAVLNVVRQVATQPELVADAVAEANELAKSHADPAREHASSLRAELAKVRRDAERLLDRIVAAGLKESATAKRRLADLEQRQAQLEAAVTEADREVELAEARLVDPVALRLALEAFSAAWDHLTLAERRELLQAMVHRIEVRRDHVVVELYDGRVAQAALNTPKKPNPGSSSTDKPGVRFRSSLARAAPCLDEAYPRARFDARVDITSGPQFSRALALRAARDAGARATVGAVRPVVAGLAGCGEGAQLRSSSGDVAALANSSGQQ